MTPLIEAVYEKLNSDPTTSTKKKDSSFFSLADGVVQALLMRLLSGVVGEIVGEEDEGSIDISQPPFRAGDLTAPVELEDSIVRLRGAVDVLALALPKLAEYQELVAFIDPIDGTKEFCTGKGEQCSICIGFATRATGSAVAGLVYRPLCPRRSWAMGCAAEATALASLNQLATEGGAAAGSFLCSNGGTSAFLQTLTGELGYEARGQGGAGNKALRVLEEPNGCYIQDRGVSRWDSCAAQAVLEAHGGLLVQLHPLTSGAADAPAECVRYSYKKGPVNTDFVPGVIRLTKYNAAEGVLTAADLDKGAPPRFAATAQELLPYSNGLGLMALRSAESAQVEAARRAILRAAERAPPSFD